MNAANRTSPRNTALFLATATLVSTSIASAQSTTWLDFRGDPSRTGTVSVPLAISQPRLAWRLSRVPISVPVEGFGPTLIEFDLDSGGQSDLVSITDRSIAAWDAATGQQRWPTGDGEYAPWQYIVGVADMNGDRSQDIIVVGRDNVVGIYDSTGVRRWTLPSNRLTPAFAGTVRVVDMTGTDTSTQLLVARTDGTDTARISLFSFDRAFAETEARSVSYTGDSELSTFRTQVGDFDGDSLPDVVTLRAAAMGAMNVVFVRGTGVAAGGSWTASTRLIAPPMTGCLPRAGATWRTQTFAASDRDLLAVKQGPFTVARGCVAVVRNTDTASTLQWSRPLPSGDSVAAPYVSNLAGSPSPEILAYSSELVTVSPTVMALHHTITVFDAITGNIVGTMEPSTDSNAGYVWLGNARIEGESVDTIVASTPLGTRVFFRHNGASFERGALLGSLNIDRWPRLIEGVEIYGLPSGGRVEPIVVGTGANAAVLARTSASEHRVLGLRRNDPTPSATTGLLVGGRRRGRGAFVVSLPAALADASLRKLAPSLMYDGRAFVGDGFDPPLFLWSRPSYTTSAFRQELRAARIGFSRGDTILSSNRASLIDATEATPFDVIPSSVPNPNGCTENLQATIGAWTSTGEAVFLPTANSPIDTGTRMRFEPAMRNCSRTPLFSSQFAPATATGVSFNGDFARLPISGLPAQPAFIGWLQRDVGLDRELSASAQNTGDQRVTISFPTQLAASLPSLGTIGGTSFLAVNSTVNSGAAPPHEIHFVVGERPLRITRSPLNGPPLQFAALQPILVPASEGHLLLVNNSPNTSSNSAYARPTVWRVAPSGTGYTVTLAAWTSNATLMDSQPASVVRCGADQYRLIFRSRVTATTGEEAKIEAWQFSRTAAAPAMPDFAVATNLEQSWQLCLDRAAPAYDCATPPPSPRLGRASWSGIAASQNNTSPVAVITNSAGQTFAIEDVCARGRVRWAFQESRSAAAPSIIDSDGDNDGEVVVLSSDGTYHGIDQRECDRVGDPRCPASRPVCDVAAKTCVECLANADCASVGRGTCNADRRLCVPCTMTGAGCDPSGGTCTETVRGGVSVLVCSCVRDTDCSQGFACVRPQGTDAGVTGVCTAGCNPREPRCPLGLQCSTSGDAGIGRCVGACTSDDQCASGSPSRPVCSSASDAGARACVECNTSGQCEARDPTRPVCGANRCVQCSASESALCTRDGRGSRCLGDGRCGCESDSDCSLGRCNPQTRACTTGADSGVATPWADNSCACDARALTASSRASDAGRALVLAAVIAAALSARKKRRTQRYGVALGSSALALATIAPDARAQVAPTTATAAPRAPTRRAVQCGEDASADLFAEAREHFDAGQTALLANDAAGAERSLRTSIALFDSPNTHLLLGRALAAQGRLEDAYDEFETSVALATRCSVRDSTERGRARYMRSIEQGAVERGQLAPRVALFSARFEGGAPSGATIQLGDRPPIALVTDRTVAATPGSDVRVHIRAPGYQDWNGTVTLDRGRVAAVEVALQRIVAQTRVIERTVERQLVAVRRIPAAFGVGLAVAGAGIAATATGAALYLTARGRYATLEQACTMSICPNDPSFLRAAERGERLEFAGQVTLWTGLGVSVVGAVITLIALPRTEYVPVRAPRPGVALRPSLGALALEGAF
jgi:hypothetical protein